ncbi:MAG: hypothetical protein RR495_00680 [Anaerovoracaceae bacterium]
MTKNIWISKNANKNLIEYFERRDINVNILNQSNVVYNQISTHPDIYMCKLGVNNTSPVFWGNKSKISYSYPGNIIYNACSTGKYFIHNLKYTDKDLLYTATSLNQELINIKQGYAKCNILPINENSIITSDLGIAKKCSNLDVLIISPGHIKLKGFDTGFIGGTSGIIDGTVVFNGDLSSHPDFKKIKDFITNKGLCIKYFDSYPLEDIGSIIYEEK